MNYTTVKAVWLKDKSFTLCTIPDSAETSFAVWESIRGKYLKSSTSSNVDSLDSAYKDVQIPRAIRAVLLMTLDQSYIVSNDFAQAANDIGYWLQEFSSERQTYSNWCVIKSVFEAAPLVPAIGLHCNSRDPEPFVGEWDDMTEDYGPTNWNICRNVYDVLAYYD